MKKVITKLVILCLLISTVFTTTAFAAGRPSIIYEPPTDSKLLPPNQSYSQDTTQALKRGSLLSTCILKISNIGKGEIGILADTMCHVDVDAIYVTIYLDQYDEANDEWLNKKVYQYEFTPDDTDDGKLHAKLINFHEKSQPAGYYYRAWAYHEVEKDGRWEIMKTGTDGVLITSTP